jgi:hypothetical protein
MLLLVAIPLTASSVRHARPRVWLNLEKEIEGSLDETEEGRNRNHQSDGKKNRNHPSIRPKRGTTGPALEHKRYFNGLRSYSQPMYKRERGGRGASTMRNRK